MAKKDDRNTHDLMKTSGALTKDAKAMIQMAFNDLGGLQRLVEWANHPANLGTFYTHLWAKIIPKEAKAELSGPGGKPLQIEAIAVDQLSNLGDEEIDQLEDLLGRISQSDDEDIVIEEGNILEYK